MRGKRIAGMLALCFLGLSVLVWVRLRDWRLKNPVPYVDRVLGMPVVQDTDFLAGKERLACGRNPGVFYEGVLLPFDRDGTLYLPQDGGEEWLGKLSAPPDTGFLCVEEDPYWKRKSDAIRDNHSFTLWLVGEGGYYEMRLVVTGTPVMSIQTTRREAQARAAYEEDPDEYFYGGETLYYGTVDLFNPGIRMEEYEIIQSYVCYHQKGATASAFEKKSYSISLRDSDGQNADVSLLGMREDDDWKLNALFNDPNRIREISASRLWGMFGGNGMPLKQAGAGMEYVELVLDGRYEGIYCLVEPIDKKQLGLGPRDVLYKVVNGGVPDDEDIGEAARNGWKLQYPIRLRYPKSPQDYEAAWYPMRDYLSLFYRNRDVSYQEMATKTDAANLCDMLIFLMVTSASDNSYNNIYYAARVDEEGRYVMYLIPWDLDLTFGSRADFGQRNFRIFDGDYGKVYTVEAAEKLIAAAPDEMWPYLGDRWEEYRAGFLSTESVLGILTQNRDYLVETGAAIREQERWPEEEVETDIQELLDFQRKRMEWLDGYFGAEQAPWQKTEK